MADEVVINSVDTEIIGFAPLGEVFSSVRNAKKLALKDVSNNLRLSVKQIEALENNDFSSLPPAMITRGFIRNYARLLELDAEPLLASYRARMPDEIPSTLSVKTSMNQVMPTSAGSQSWLKYMLLGGLILLSVASWFYYANYMQKPAQKATEDIAAGNVSESVAEVALPEVALPAAERQPEVDVNHAELALGSASADSDVHVSTSQTTPSAPVVVPPKVEPASQPVVSNPAVVTQNLPLPKEVTVDFNTLKEKAVQKNQLTTVVSGANAKAVPPDMKTPELAQNSLKTDSSIAAIKGVNIAVSEQTWIRVTDKSGAVVFEKMLQANSTDGFNGLPPFKMLIGNAKATKVTFLGQNVDLTSKTRSNVARITLE